MSRHDKKEDKKSESETGEKHSRKGRSRTRFVDYMRVEDTVSGQPLSYFELKVKEKLASVPSPAEEWIEGEETEERNEQVRSALAHLVQKAKLTRSQLLCYQMVYVDTLPDKELADCLHIAERNVRRLKQSVFNALKGVYEKERIKKLADTYPLTNKQRLVVSLRYGDQLSLKEIADRLHVTVRAVDILLCRLRKKFSLGKKFPNV